MRYQTFAEWKEGGYQIIKGSKSTKRNGKGEALFSDVQVRVRRSAGRRNIWGGSSDSGAGDWDDNPGYSDLGIDDFQ